MTLRTRLVVAFLYVLLAVVLALTIPLAVSLSRRGKADLEARTLIDAQTMAAYLDRSVLADPARLSAVVAQTTPDRVERVIVTDADGRVIYDTDDEAIGRNFANGERPEIDAALLGQPTAGDRFSDTLDQPILVAAAPVIQGTPIGAIRLTRDYAEVDEATRRTVVALFAIGGTAVVAGVIIAFALAGSIARPIQRLAGAAHRLGEGDLDARAGETGGAAEVQDLARSFDAMADRLQRTVTAQREFVANASHQLRTPLTGLKLRLEGAIDATDDAEQRRRLEAADAEVDRLAQIVERLLAVARRVELGEPTQVDLREAAQGAAERWRERAATLGATIEVSGGQAAAAADPTDVAQIFDNLLDNAIAYAAGPIRIDTSDGDRATALVVDRGPGIDPRERDRVTERFYRGRAAPPGGSGLGLAIVRDLAEKWDGTIAISPTDGGGTTVTVTFPPAATTMTEVRP
jgi:signal transduction histidine kinase